MSRFNWGRAIWSAVIGLVLGVFLAEHRIRELAPSKGKWRLRD